ncbi:MAG: hypothetical protein KDA60_01520 [Planctomycetales bacterium]|nr:hypothetical protein [Planctomycetales bacterium]
MSDSSSSPTTLLSRVKPRILLGGVMLFLMLAALCPQLIELPLFHKFLLSRATGKIQGRAEIAEVQLGWWRPARIRGLTLSSLDNVVTVEVASCEGERTLWQQLWRGRDLGTFRVVQPRLIYALDGQGVSNFSRTFASTDSPGDTSSGEQDDIAKALVSQLTAQGEIIDGQFVYRASPDQEPWTLGPFNLSLGLEKGADKGDAQAVVHPGQLATHTELTTQICNDLMKFVAPVLADVTWIEGEFSLAIHEARFPLHDPASGTLRGTLEIHAVHAGPNEVITQVLSDFGVRSTITLVEESPVQFSLADRRVHHEGLRFRAGDVTIDTSGFVGLDESLDLTATVTLPTMAPEGPVRRVLADRAIELPIRGTLSRPAIERGFFRREGQSLLTELLPEVTGQEQMDWGAIVEDLEQWGRATVRRRRESAASGEPPESRIPEQRPVRRLLRGLIDRTLDDASVDESTEPDATMDESETSAASESKNEPRDSAEPEEGPLRRPLRELLRRRQNQRNDTAHPSLDEQTRP